MKTRRVERLENLPLWLSRHPLCVGRSLLR
jgi:hypothetical protein